MFADADIPEPPPPSIRDRLRRLGARLVRPLAVLLVPDRALRLEVSGGRYGLALFITLVAALLAAGAVGARLDLAPAVMAENAAAPRTPGAAEAGAAPTEVKSDREINEEIQHKTAVARVKLGLAAGLGTPAEIVLLALALLLLGRYVGGKPTFRRSLSAAANGALPWALRSLVMAAAAWRQSAVLPRQIGALVVGRVPIGPGHPVLARLLARVDLFTLWSVILLGFGLSAAAGISRKKSFITIAVGLLIYLLVTRLIAGGAPPAPGVR